MPSMSWWNCKSLNHKKSANIEAEAIKQTVFRKIKNQKLQKSWSFNEIDKQTLSITNHKFEIHNRKFTKNINQFTKNINQSVKIEVAIKYLFGWTTVVK